MKDYMQGEGNFKKYKKISREKYLPAIPNPYPATR
jgi:hypothetical protein